MRIPWSPLLVLIVLVMGPSTASAPLCLGSACLGEESREGSCDGRDAGETWATLGAASVSAWHSCGKDNVTSDAIVVVRQGGPVSFVVWWTSGMPHNQSAVAATVQAHALVLETSWQAADDECGHTFAVSGPLQREHGAGCAAGAPPGVPPLAWGRILP